MPQNLIDATVDHRNGRIDDDTYAVRIDGRRAYEMKPKSSPRPDGSYRMMCPAEAGTAYCPIKPIAQKPGAVRIRTAPDSPGPACDQKSVTFDAFDGDRFRQPLRFRSPEWHRMYGTPRNTIESTNGLLKDGGRHVLDDASRRRVRGFAAAAVFTSLLIVAMNLHKLDAFLTTESEPPKATRRGARVRNDLAHHHPARQASRAPPDAA